MSSTGTRARAPFTMVLPAGWSRIPVGAGSAAAVRRILDRATARADDPRAAGVRRRLEQLLMAQVDAAAKQSGVELYLPTSQVHGVTVPASVIVSAPRVTEGTDPMDTLLAVAARSPGAEVVEIDGKPAVRSVRRSHTPRMGEGFEGMSHPTRQVVYYLADPADQRRYLVVSAQVLEAEVESGTALADAVTELVDAMLTTFRWLPRPEEGTA